MKIKTQMKSDLEEFDFKVADGLSRMYLVICNDDNVQKRLLTEFHAAATAGHRSPETTVQKIQDHGYTWRGIMRDARNTIKRCKDCQTNKLYKKTKLPMIITDTTSEA